MNESVCRHNLAQRNISFCFSFDDGCGNWKNLTSEKYSYCISLDRHTWCCDFEQKKIKKNQIYDHLNTHDRLIYNSLSPVTELTNDLSPFENIIVLPFGGANYFMNVSFLSKIKDMVLVTTMNKSLLDEFIVKKGISDILMKNNLVLIPRTSYYNGDNVFSLIGRANGYSNFLQRHMQG